MLEKKECVQTLKAPEKEFGISTELEQTILKISKQFSSAKKFEQFIYTHYPEYALRSELTPRKKQETSPQVFSIGYQGKNIDGFRNQLIQNNVSVLVDVRNHAFSMKHGFSKKQLEKYLERTGIAYEHIKELGVESKKRKNLENKNTLQKLFVEYRKELGNKKEFVQKIMELGKKKRIALLCFEANPQECHRSILGQKLESQGMPVLHL